MQWEPKKHRSVFGWQIRDYLNRNRFHSTDFHKRLCSYSIRTVSKQKNQVKYHGIKRSWCFDLIQNLLSRINKKRKTLPDNLTTPM